MKKILFAMALMMSSSAFALSQNVCWQQQPVELFRGSFALAQCQAAAAADNLEAQKRHLPARYACSGVKIVAEYEQIPGVCGPNSILPL